MRPKFTQLLVGAAAGALAWTSFSLGLFAGFENFIEDLLFTPKTLDSDLVVIAVDDESLQRLGQWPWRREIFAQAFLALEKNPPQAVGFDVMLAEPSRFGPSDDNALAAALGKISFPVVLPVEASPLLLQEAAMPQAGKMLVPLPPFRDKKTTALGHVNLILDSDGVARRVPTVIDAGESTTFRALAYKLLEKSGRTIPHPETLQNIERIVYAAPTGAIRRIPFWRLLAENPPNLAGKIALIGATAADLHDEKPTPLSRGSQMPGVEIQANIANMLTQGLRLYPLDKKYSSWWILTAAMIPALTFIVLVRSLKPLLVNIAFGAISTLAAIILFEKGRAANLLHINFSWMLSTASLFSYRYFYGEKERREMRNLFSKYVSTDVLEEILRDPAKVALGGEEKEVTVFFSDIRGFTTLSEKTTPRELVGILNRYFTAMSEEILKHGGVLDKYIGDAIMAFWGAPIADLEQADRALASALGMLAKLKELNSELREKWGLTVNIGIGIHTGPAVVGNIGSAQRFDYTAIGDTVNVASRLESLNKEHNTQIIIGESTKNRVKGNYSFKDLGAVAVKGRKEPLRIYTLGAYQP